MPKVAGMARSFHKPAGMTGLVLTVSVAIAISRRQNV
jgi:hypothetical protein